MLVVKIELHSAVTGTVEEIGRMYIANDGTGSGTRGNYDAAIMRRGSKPGGFRVWADVAAKATKRGRVENYPRLSYSVWELIRRALTNALGTGPVPADFPICKDCDESVPVDVTVCPRCADERGP